MDLHHDKNERGQPGVARGFEQQQSHHGDLDPADGVHQPEREVPLFVLDDLKLEPEDLCQRGAE